MSNLIDKQQAIEAICMETCGVSLRNERCMVHCTEVQAVEKLPSTQPDVPDINVGDIISRQAALDALRGYLVGKRCPDDGTLTCRLIENEVINKLPPANNSEIPNSSDTISRQAAIEVIDSFNVFESRCDQIKLEQMIGELPPAQPETIRCRECKFASGDSRICMKFGHSPIGELDFCAWAERRTDE